MPQVSAVPEPGPSSAPARVAKADIPAREPDVFASVFTSARRATEDSSAARPRRGSTPAVLSPDKKEITSPKRDSRASGKSKSDRRGALHDRPEPEHIDSPTRAERRRDSAQRTDQAAERSNQSAQKTHDPDETTGNRSEISEEDKQVVAETKEVEQHPVATLDGNAPADSADEHPQPPVNVSLNCLIHPGPDSSFGDAVSLAVFQPITAAGQLTNPLSQQMPSASAGSTPQQSEVSAVMLKALPGQKTDGEHASAAEQAGVPRETESPAKAGPGFENLMAGAMRQRSFAVDGIAAASRPQMTAASTTTDTGVKLNGPGSVGELARVVRAATVQGRSSMLLQLDPPQLGHLRIDVRMHEQMMTLRFEADTQAGQHAVQSRIAELRDALQQQGIQLNHVEVELRPAPAQSAQPQDLHGNPQQQGWSSGESFPGSQGHHANHHDSAASPPDAPDSSAGATVGGMPDEAEPNTKTRIATAPKRVDLVV